MAYAESLILKALLALPVRHESLRLVRRAKINEIKSTIILFSIWIFYFTS
ncbi:hypothetical protein D1BOALGB6SA_2896 [Olavius sp. associated proteobacterium Delta 1]|nr:hypothetical protein D1BOALGB6SA_2896 [Olavius sp. associated proteobacterium Delta 1]